MGQHLALCVPRENIRDPVLTCVFLSKSNWDAFKYQKNMLIKFVNSHPAPLYKCNNTSSVSLHLHSTSLGGIQVSHPISMFF